MFKFPLRLTVLNLPAEIKLTVAAIYTNFTTSIIESGDMEAIDAYTVKPKGEKLVLKFEPIRDS